MDLKKIQKIYKNLPDDSTEEDVKIHVVVDMLQILGYKKEWMKFEAREKERKGVTDILVNLPRGEKIIVEVKSKKSILNDDSKGQLLNYLTNRDSRWGILTNGNQFLLVDNTLKVIRNIDKYFLEVSLDNNCKMNLILFKFFSYKYIFDLKTTQYFEFYKSYAINKFIDRKSIIESQYRSACYIFFNYIGNKEYNTLELSLDNFENMVLKNNWSKETIKNKYRYIRAFLDYLEKEKYIEKNRFDLYGLKKIIEKVESKELKSNINLDSSIIDKMKNYYVGIDSKNQVIVLLFLYTLNYELIINLKRDDYSDGFIKYNSRKIKLPVYINDAIKKHLEYLKKKKIKSDYLLNNRYGGKYKKISEETIRRAVKGVFQNDKDINRNIFQSYFINDMYKKNLPIEIIAKWLELDIATVYKYIDGKLLKRNIDKHFKDIINKHTYVI
ncbi:MAG: type I restriction enzyme HsdR N-terminal domain-containing protein [Clostridium perfringens]